MDSFSFGKKISLLRKKKNLTQLQLAEIIGVTNKAISRWETGEGFPDITLLKPLAEALDTTVDMLLGDIECDELEQSKYKKTLNIGKTLIWSEEFKKKEKTNNKNVVWNRIFSGYLGVIVSSVLLYLVINLVLSITTLMIMNQKDMFQESYTVLNLSKCNIISLLIVELSLVSFIFIQRRKKLTSLYRLYNHMLLITILGILTILTFNIRTVSDDNFHIINSESKFIEFIFKQGTWQICIAICICLSVIYFILTVVLFCYKRKFPFIICGIRNLAIIISIVAVTINSLIPITLTKIDDINYVYIKNSLYNSYINAAGFEGNSMGKIIVISILIYIITEIVLYLTWFKKNKIAYGFSKFTNEFFDSLIIFNKISSVLFIIALIIAMTTIMNNINLSNNSYIFMRNTFLNTFSVVCLDTSLSLAFVAALAGIIMGYFNKTDKQYRYSMGIIVGSILIKTIMSIIIFYMFFVGTWNFF